QDLLFPSLWNGRGPLRRVLDDLRASMKGRFPRGIGSGNCRCRVSFSQCIATKRNENAATLPGEGGLPCNRGFGGSGRRRKAGGIGRTKPGGGSPHFNRNRSGNVPRVAWGKRGGLFLRPPVGRAQDAFL